MVLVKTPSAGPKGFPEENASAGPEGSPEENASAGPEGFPEDRSSTGLEGFLKEKPYASAKTFCFCNANDAQKLLECHNHYEENSMTAVHGRTFRAVRYRITVLNWQCITRIQL